MLNLSYVSEETILYTDDNDAQWSIRFVQDTLNFEALISQLSCLAEGFPSGHQKVVIVSGDYRAKIAVNAFIRFCPLLEGLVFTANTLDDAYALIKWLED
jgi:hypothetical protein